MKQIFGFKIGGLMHKIFNLVLVFILAIIGVFGCVSAYQAKELTTVVNDASNEQQQAIERVSGDTMHQVIENSMVKTNGLQAYISDDMFSEVKGDIELLQLFASELFANQDKLSLQPVDYPQLEKNGVASVQMQHSKGVDPADSDQLRVVSNMQNIMLSLFQSSDKLSSCIVSTADGVTLYVDDRSGEYFDDNGDVIKEFEARERPWYKGAVETNGVYFTGIEHDSFTDYIGVVCSAPVYYNGEVVAVVAADIFLDTMASYVNTSAENGGFVCIVDNNGEVAFSPMQDGTFRVDPSNDADDLRKSENTKLAEFISQSMTESTGLRDITIDGKNYYMAGYPIPTVGWAAISCIEKDITEMPAKMMLDEFDRVNNDATDKFENGTKHSKQTTLVMIAIVLILGSGSALYVASRIVKPVEFMTERIGELSGKDLEFKMDDSLRTGDEIEVLAESFATLSKRTVEYIQQITAITAEKERIGAELELATKIQADMLPNIYPAFPERSEFDIYATMTPAKEVGGDFYDFFLIDDDHLGMVMADVSGKGVPAALFMMMSKILVNNYALMGGSPAKVLEQVNNQICKNNEEEMFVTVWFGVLEISTGKVTAANAGHEYPILKKAGGEFELFKDKHGFVIGGMDGMRYKDYEFTLEKGGTLFLYTDGVAEATNAQNELFGTDRMIEALNKNADASPTDLLNNMKQAVDEFVGEAPQFDDLTMLGLKLN